MKLDLCDHMVQLNTTLIILNLRHTKQQVKVHNIGMFLPQSKVQQI